jgi:hypothetical protein
MLWNRWGADCVLLPMSGAGTITWGRMPWNLGMMGFPAGRTAERTPVRGPQTKQAG